jgi:hypothetical protein
MPEISLGIVSLSRRSMLHGVGEFVGWLIVWLAGWLVDLLVGRSTMS